MLNYRKLLSFIFIGSGVLNFEKLVLGFYHDTESDGYDALHELEQQIARGSDKGKIIQKIRQEHEMEPSPIRFYKDYQQF
jgi:hypothetical protein